jgi:Uma2 family endonuclease
MTVAPSHSLLTADEFLARADEREGKWELHCGLSPSMAAYDQSEKLAGYFSVPSVMHYLFLSPESRMVVHHKHGRGDLIEARLLREGVLRLDPPGIEVAAAALFATD